MFENGLAKPTVHGHCEVPGAFFSWKPIKNLVPPEESPEPSHHFGGKKNAWWNFTPNAFERVTGTRKLGHSVPVQLHCRLSKEAAELHNSTIQTCESTMETHCSVKEFNVTYTYIYIYDTYCACINTIYIYIICHWCVSAQNKKGLVWPQPLSVGETWEATVEQKKRWIPSLPWKAIDIEGILRVTLRVRLFLTGAFYVGLLDGLLGVAGMIMNLVILDHSRKFPAKHPSYSMMWGQCSHSIKLRGHGQCPSQVADVEFLSTGTIWIKLKIRNIHIC